MKATPHHITIGFMLLLPIATPLFATGSASTPEPSSTVRLTRSSATGVKLTVTNAGDQVWIIQSSSNLVDWLEVQSWKIHNGSFQGSYDSTGNPNLFYRASYDAARQNISSTTANA